MGHPEALETAENDDRGRERRKGSKPEALTQIPMKPTHLREADHVKACSSAPVECRQAGMQTKHCKSLCFFPDKPDIWIYFM